MIQKERRRHFLIDKPLQFRYMFTIVLTLCIIASLILISLYFGIWGGILDAFSDEKIRNDLLTASRIEEYEVARHPLSKPEGAFSTLSLFRQAERLSDRQREVFKSLLDQTNQNLIWKLILLFALIGWGTIFLSHKIAGPLYRFQKIFEELIQGNLSVRCQLRKFDEAKPVAYTLNHALESVDSQVARVKKIIRENEKNPDRLLNLLKEELSKLKTSG